MNEIINGWLVIHKNEPFMKVMAQFIKDELSAGPYKEDTDMNLILLAKDKHSIEVYSDNLVVSTGPEFRFIHEDEIDDTLSDEVDDLYDVEYWKEAVASDNTEDGYEDWLEQVSQNVSYGEFFGTYDGGEEYIEDWYYFRVN
jgi:hypothetical protein